MTKFIDCVEIATVYAVVVSALVGPALNALVQFYPIY